MAWVDPQTDLSFSTSEVVTATKLNKIRDNFKELFHVVAYVEFTGTVTATSGTHTEAAPLDVVSAGAFTFLGFPSIVEFFAPQSQFTNGAGHAGVGFSLWESTDLGSLGAARATSSGFVGPTGGCAYLTPSAGAHTYRVRIWATTAGSSATLQGGPSGVGQPRPGYIRIWEKGGA